MLIFSPQILTSLLFRLLLTSPYLTGVSFLMTFMIIEYLYHLCWLFHSWERSSIVVRREKDTWVFRKILHNVPISSAPPQNHASYLQVLFPKWLLWIQGSFSQVLSHVSILDVQGRDKEGQGTDGNEHGKGCKG